MRFFKCGKRCAPLNQNLLGEDGVLLCPAHPTPAPFRGQAASAPLNSVYAGVFSALGLPATVAPVGPGADGTPLAVQVLAAPHMDRLTLAVARALERPFGGWAPPYRARGEPGELLGLF